jgi:hypothetical protein
LLSVINAFIKEILPKLAKDVFPIFEESATRNTSSDDFIIADFTTKSLKLGYVSCILAEIPAVAKNNLLACKLLNGCAAISPVNDNVGALNSPPVTIRLIFGFSPNIRAILSALVIIVRFLNETSSLAISVVVEPESRMIQSPSFIKLIAFLAISLFSSIFF